MRKRFFLAALFAAYLVVLLRITVFRDGWYSHGLCTGTLVWIPFQKIFGFLRNGHARLFCYLFFGNIVWFVPFGAYLRLRGCSAGKTILLTAALSALIETLQFVFGCGWTETEDVILNTAGGAIGCAIAAGYRKRKKKTE